MEKAVGTGSKGAGSTTQGAWQRFIGPTVPGSCLEGSHPPIHEKFRVQGFYCLKGLGFREFRDVRKLRADALRQPEFFQGLGLIGAKGHGV